VWTLSADEEDLIGQIPGLMSSLKGLVVWFTWKESTNLVCASHALWYHILASQSPCSVTEPV